MYRASTSWSNKQPERRISVDISNTNTVPIPVRDLKLNSAKQNRQEREKRKRPKSKKTNEQEPIYQIVDTSTWAKASTNYQIDTTDLWENEGATTPEWMRDYFRWHKEQLANNWYTPETTISESHRFLYVTCLKDYHKCGGTADRLLSLPFFVKVAAMTKRILIFQWSKPAALEEFLMPPAGGIDWRVPESKERALQDIGEKAGTQETILEMAHQSKNKVLQVKFQSNDHGSRYYNAIRESDKEAGFVDIFHVVWKIFFTPSPTLASRVELTLKQNRLEPGNYTSAHLRALYNVQARDPRAVRDWSKNALHCALYIQNRSSNFLPVYFASDSEHATRQAVTYGNANGLTVYGIKPTEELQGDPLHLDKVKDWKKRPASDFIDIFVDLYVMALAKCVSYGMGGFGLFASYLSGNPSCGLQHMSATMQEECPRPRNALRKRRGIGRNKPNEYEPEWGDIEKPALFLEPMPKRRSLIKIKRQTENTSKKVVRSKEDILAKKIKLFPDTTKSFENIWESSIRLPKWAKEYFLWHSDQKKRISGENWADFRYLAVVCLRDSKKCGGTADRLRPVPFFIKVAAETNRVLLIYWERPAPLESFLLPPSGGLDWRTPDWMVPHIQSSESTFMSTRKLVQEASGNSVIVKSMIQAHDHGSAYYNSQEIALGRAITDAFRQDYRDIWYTCFTPVPAIAGMVENELDRMELVPGGYSFAHVRALYDVEDEGRDPSLIKYWAENALNCLSNIRPGGPFFFSSDSAVAKQAAVEYGRQRKVSVVTRANEPGIEPLHIDKVQDWETRDPSDFFGVFADLYLMSLGSCYSFNVGGFGRWANHISGKDFTCHVRHWTTGVNQNSANKNGCGWTDSPSGQRIKQRKRSSIPLFLPPKP